MWGQSMSDRLIIAREGDSFVLYLNAARLSEFEDQDQAERAASAASRMLERRGKTVEIDTAALGQSERG